MRVPWRGDAAAAQRVIFCVYNEDDELRLRARIDEFDLATRDSGHKWFAFDLTDTFAEWMSAQRYAERYYQKPALLATLLPKYLEYIAGIFHQFLDSSGADNESVVALSGVGSLFGLCKVKDIVDNLAPMVKGRLVVFFPGTFENDNYRLLDGYDGWNYLSVPITADMEA
jgi:Domain of unknown function (DUF1788).